MNSVTLILLTYNRLEVTERCLEHNLKNAGHKIDEMVCVDNGSTDGVRDYVLSKNFDTYVLFNENTGVSNGFNECYKHATSDLIVRPCTDTTMPDNWLKIMIDCYNLVKNPGLIGMYPTDDIPKERVLGKPLKIEEYTLLPSLVLNSVIFSRKCLDEVDFLPKIGETKYGWEDVIWAERFIEKRYNNYYILGHNTNNLGNSDSSEYKEWKREQAELGRKVLLDKSWSE